MSIASWWKNIKETPAKNWYYSRIPDDQTPKDIDSTPPQANEAYLDIHMKSMCIVNVRNGFSTFYPAIHSFISLDYIGNSKAEFNYVTTPGNLEQLDSAHIDRVININKRLLGPVPYRGGDVELEIGLFSVKSANLAAPFISLLTNMSEIAGVSFIGKVLPFADPISKGVDLLVGNSDNAELEIGLSTHMKQIQTGYYVAMGCDKSKVKEEDLFIDKRDYKLIDKNGNAIREYPYMVISISHSNRKDDWFYIPEIAETYKKLQEDIKKRDITAASNSLEYFRIVVLTSNDLIFSDAQKIVDQVKKNTIAILPTVSVSTHGIIELPDLHTYQIY